MNVRYGVLASLWLLMSGCGLSDPEIPRAFYFDPPDENAGTDLFDVRVNNQYIARLTPTGFDLSGLEKYTGEPLTFHSSAWNPDDQVIYSYRANENPGEMWLVSVSVPGMKRQPLSRMPEHPRGSSFSPIFAYDLDNSRLVVADGQRPCGARFSNIWFVYDIASASWAKRTLDGYAFTTLDYDPEEDVFVGVGMGFDPNRRIVARIDFDGNILSEVDANLCDALKPRIHGYDEITYQSQVVKGTVHIYRHVYYGRKAENGVYWERQHYTVDAATGNVSRR